MPALVAEVAQQRAVRLLHALARTFAKSRVGFGDIERDHAILVPGHDFLAGHILQKFERQTGDRGIGFRHRLQLQVPQRIQQAPLGSFQPGPVHMILRGQRGTGHGQLARSAQLPGRVGRHHPVADTAVRVIEALLVGKPLVGRIQTAPGAVLLFLERADVAELGLIAEQAATVFALDILEKDLLAALIAVEGFHWAQTGRGGVE